MDIVKALEFGWPKEQWSVGETYESLVFHSGDKPTLNDIEAAWNDYVAEKEANSYKEKRAKEYPPVTDQLDAIMKWIDSTEGAPEDLALMAKACMDIKEKYPKGGV